MSKDFENTTSHEANNISKKQTLRLTRRRMMQGGAGLVGLATVAGAGRAIANTQQPIAPQQGLANPNGKFAGKVVLITGATSGIGEATARAFAKEGAKVHFCGRREALGEKVAQEINALGGVATYQRADVRVEEDVKSFIDGCVERYGRIDIAFNNAGTFVSAFRTIADTPLDEWMNVMNTNAQGVFLSMKYELPVMLRQGGGIIVNNASVAGHVGFATQSPYNASKHAIISLTKVAALEYSDKNIRINSISPGAVDTPQLRGALGMAKVSFEQAAQDYPIKRIVNPEEIARAVMWLSSADPTCIVGTDIDVTGGYLSELPTPPEYRSV